MDIDLSTIRSDDHELIIAVAELNSAIKEALIDLASDKAAALNAAIQHYSNALINRITVISGTDQMDLVRLRDEFAAFQREVRADLEALQQRVYDTGQNEPYQI